MRDRRVATSLFAVVALGCGAPPPPPPPPLAAASVPLTTAQPVAAQAVAAQPVAAQPQVAAKPALLAKPTLPPPPAGIDADAWQLLSTLCPIGTFETRDGSLQLGCRGWPPWTKPEARPDGFAPRGKNDDNWKLKWDVAGLQATSFLRYVKSYRGAFTRVAADQTLFYFENCRRMDGITITGCAAIVELNAGKLSVVDVHATAPFDDCVVNPRADGRDLLVCHNTTGAIYESLTTSVFYVDFSKQNGSRRTRIAELAHNAFSIDCDSIPKPGADYAPSGTWTSGIVDLKLDKLHSKDVNRDGLADLTIELRRAHQHYTPALVGRVRQQCRGMKRRSEDFGPRVPAQGLMPKPTPFNLQFHNDGQGLVPTSGTARVMKVWATQHAPHRYAW